MNYKHFDKCLYFAVANIPYVSGCKATSSSSRNLAFVNLSCVSEFRYLMWETPVTNECRELKFKRLKLRLPAQKQILDVIWHIILFIFSLLSAWQFKCLSNWL